MHKEIIDKAIEWWIKDLQSPTISSVEPDPTEEQIQIFSKNLSISIKDQVHLHGKCLLKVDLEPNEPLNKALTISGITKKLSFETKMLVGENIIVVSKGIGSAFEEVYSYIPDDTDHDDKIYIK